MKKKLLIIGLAIVAIVAICAGSIQLFGKEKDRQTQKPGEEVSTPGTTNGNNEDLPVPLSDEDFIISDDSTFIELGDSYKNLKTDEKITSARYYDENRVYNVFAYENFTVTTGINVQETIGYIYLVTPALKTSRGIGVGDTILDVFKKYGAVSEERPGLYFYDYNYKFIAFYVDAKGIITAIHLELV